MTYKTSYCEAGVYIEESDLAPCPHCGSSDLGLFANVVACMDCDYEGPNHGFDESGNRVPEILCDWREAIVDWNEEANKLSQPTER